MYTHVHTTYKHIHASCTHSPHTWKHTHTHTHTHTHMHTHTLTSPFSSLPTDGSNGKLRDRIIHTWIQAIQQQTLGQSQLCHPDMYSSQVKNM